MNKAATVDEYINSQAKEVQPILNNLRQAIKKLAPDAVESINYGIPAYKLNGKPLVYFAGYKTHIGFYPTPNGMEKFKKELTPFATGKGTAQFSIDQPLPMELITKIIEFRIEETNKGESFTIS